MKLMIDAIKHAEITIADAINHATAAAYKAGRASGMQTAITTAERVATEAKTPQGQGAARAVAARIQECIDGEAKG